MIIQFCGLSGAGKTTLAKLVQSKLLDEGIKTEVIDGDEYRKTLCRDLGFSKEDRQENMLRMAFVARQLSKHGIVAIISAINPFASTRSEVARRYPDVKTVFIDCELPTLLQRDTKGLYKRALLPDGHAEKLPNLTGINAPFDVPAEPDLYINTTRFSTEQCASQLLQFIRQNRKKQTAARSRAAAEEATAKF